MARHPEYEALLIENPEDVKTALVYADWLLSQGDPRGELMTLQHAGKADAARQLIEEHEDYFLGPLAPYQIPMDDSDTEVFAWELGFIRKARLSYDVNADVEGRSSEAALEALLTHPSGVVLREVVLAMNMLDDGCYFEPLTRVLAEHGAPALRSLRLGEFDHHGPRPPGTRYDYETSWTHYPDLGALWPKLPRLESLTIQGCLGDYGEAGSVGAVSLPRLKHLAVISGGVREDNIRSFTQAQWPELETFELWTGDPGYGFSGGLGDVLPLIEGTAAPRLSSLGLVNSTFTDELVAALASSKVLPQLKRLDLGLGTLSDEGAQALLTHRERFAHLERLDVSENFLSAAGLNAVAQVCKNVVTGKQKQPRDNGQRYVSLGE